MCLLNECVTGPHGSGCTDEVVQSIQTSQSLGHQVWHQFSGSWEDVRASSKYFLMKWEAMVHHKVGTKPPPYHYMDVPLGPGVKVLCQGVVKKIEPWDCKKYQRALRPCQSPWSWGHLLRNLLTGSVTSRCGLVHLLSKPLINLQEVLWALIITAWLAYH